VRLTRNFPDWLKDRFKGSSQAYGHLGSFDMMIEVGKVIEAKAVDDGTKPKAAADELRHEMQHAVIAEAARKAAVIAFTLWEPQQDQRVSVGRAERRSHAAGRSRRSGLRQINQLPRLHRKPRRKRRCFASAEG